MLRTVLKQLSEHRSVGNSTSLITMYIPGSTRVSEINHLVTDELSKASNIKSRQTRQGVQSGLTSISAHLKDISKFPEFGLILFSGKTEYKSVFEMIEPPRAVDRFLY